LCHYPGCLPRFARIKSTIVEEDLKRKSRCRDRKTAKAKDGSDSNAAGRVRGRTRSTWKLPLPLLHLTFARRQSASPMAKADDDPTLFGVPVPPCTAAGRLACRRALVRVAPLTQRARTRRVNRRGTRICSRTRRSGVNTAARRAPTLLCGRGEGEVRRGMRAIKWLKAQREITGHRSDIATHRSRREISSWLTTKRYNCPNDSPSLSLPVSETRDAIRKPRDDLAEEDSR